MKMNSFNIVLALALIVALLNSFNAEVGYIYHRNLYFMRYLRKENFHLLGEP
jgi:hypothetical protein